MSTLTKKSWWILLMKLSSWFLVHELRPGVRAHDHLLHSQVSVRRGSSGNLCLPSLAWCLSEPGWMLFSGHLYFLTSVALLQFLASGLSHNVQPSPHRKAQLYSCILKNQGLHYFFTTVKRSDPHGFYSFSFFLFHHWWVWMLWPLLKKATTAK